MVGEVAVLGGGLAGGAAALLLARSGIPVRLLEREAEPRDKICGEFLSIEAQRDLAAMGLDARRLGAVPVSRLRLVAGSREVAAALPFTALGLSRKLLDEALLEAATAAGAAIERGVRVTGLQGSKISTSTGPLPADRILLATGKHDLRGVRRAEPAGRGGYVGFKMHWRTGPPVRTAMAGAIELVLFAGGYAGLQMVSPDVLNLCLILRQERLAEAGGNWDGLFAELMREPGIARRLGDAQPLLGQPLTIANLPYGFVCGADPQAPRHLFRLGDQAAMTASLTGDGMAIALRSAHLAARSLAEGEDALAYHRRLRSMVRRQVGRAMLLQRAAQTPWAMQAGVAALGRYPRLLAALARATRLPQWAPA